MVVTKKRLTVEEFARLPTGQGVRYELVNGELRTMAAAGGRHGAVVARITVRLGSFLESHDLGVLFGAETGFFLQRNPNHLRAPDAAFVTHERLAGLDQVAGFLEVAPDFVVEVVSPSDSWSDVTSKAQDWLDRGVRIAWLVDPEAHSVEVWRTGGRVERRARDEEVDAEPALPGFRCRASELFPKHLSGF
ncbi:MAG: Uma2 family endonuclease [Chloroflexota bacterium]